MSTALEQRALVEGNLELLPAVARAMRIPVQHRDDAEQDGYFGLRNAARSWDGSALFRDHRLFPRVVFCTEAVKRLSKAEQHTNCRFEEMIPTPDE